MLTTAIEPWEADDAAAEADDHRGHVAGLRRLDLDVAPAETTAPTPIDAAVTFLTVITSIDALTPRALRPPIRDVQYR